MSCTARMRAVSALGPQARRFASAQAAPAAARPAAAIATTHLPNKLFVAAYDNGSPAARITVAYKAGARYEPANEPGLTHVLRTMAGNTTSGASAFAIMRNLQQFGCTLTATADRETMCYTLESSRAFLEDAVTFLNDVASRQIFYPWEVKDNSDRLKIEIAGLAPQVRALDLLHKAAFRRGLGNSLFSPPRQIGKISPESLQHFVTSNFTAERCSVAAVGIPLERAVAIAQTLSLSSGSVTPTPSPYLGGELRKEIGGELAHVAIAVEGTNLNNSKDALALAVLSRAIGNGPFVKWGANNSALYQAIAKQLGGTPFAVNGFNISYSDSGLFGVLLSVPVDHANAAVQIAGKMLKSGLSSIGSDALKRGRAQLQTEILCAGDTPSALVEGMAVQGLLTGAIPRPSDVAENISKITDSDISSVAAKISKGKMSMGAVGAIVNVPYVDEIQ